MKSIKKITDKVTNNVSSLAGSALLVGATLTGGAAFAAAQSGSSGSSMDLGDYPQPFVTEDGEVDTSIVIGSDAATIDVVGAVEIAGSLGNAAFGEESVSVSGSGVAASWSAENGVTLDRQNSPLFLSDDTDEEQTTLDEADLNVLETTSFQSEDDEEVEVEHEVEVGEQHQNFNSGVGDVDDPVLHVTNPTDPTSGVANHLLRASVEFSDTMDFSAAGENSPSLDTDADEWIEDGDTVEMFGQDYTFSDESDESELVLYGSSDRVEVNTGESTTVTVDGDEVQLESTYVAEDGESATVVVGGTTENVEEGDSVGPNGNVRISDIYRTGPDGQGRVAFSQGSDELVIQNDGDVEVDGDTLDGVEVNVDSADTGFEAADGMDFYFGAADSDEDYVGAGESYEAPLFGLEFHYGGLSGDTAENPAEAITVEANEDDVADITLNQGEDESADITFADNSATNSGTELAVDEDEDFATFEGQHLEEDDRVVLNANEEASIFDVTSLTEDLAGASSGNGDVSVTLENVVTGESVTIEEDEISDTDSEYDSSTSPDTYTLDSESIEGMDFDVTFYDGDDEVSFARSSGDSDVQVFPTVYTSSDAGMAFTEDQEAAGTSFADVDVNISGSDGDDEYQTTIELPSTVSSSANTVTLDVNEDASDELEADVDGNTATLDTTGTGSSSDATLEFMAGETVYELTLRNTDQATSEGATDTTTVSHYISVDGDQQVNGPDSDDLGPAAFVVQPEDDEDEELGYFFEPDVTDGNGNMAVTYTGQTGTNDGQIPENSWMTADLDSEDNVEVGYNDYGSYTMYDTDADDSETFNLHLPSGQSSSGMAITGTDGELSASGGGGGSAMAATPTYEMADGVLDSDGNVNQVKNNENVIVVGGPNANSLTQELVDDNQSMPASDYTQGQGMIQMVDGWSSGNSALVVAGYSGEDTRTAAEFLADYRNNQDALEGQSEVTIETSSGSVVSN